MTVELILADVDLKIYRTCCPECRFPLEWHVQTPPIPRRFFQWVNPYWLADEPGYNVDECPSCEATLPDGDIREQVPA